jgi:hypothetical protein
MNPSSSLSLSTTTTPSISTVDGPIADDVLPDLTCQNCADKPAEFWCYECEQALCGAAGENCEAELHVGATRTHKREPLSGVCAQACKNVRISRALPCKLVLTVGG